MTEFDLPLLELSILLPVVGAVVAVFLRDAHRARHWAAVIALLTLVSSSALLVEYSLIAGDEAADRWEVWTLLSGRHELVVDPVSAPLLPLASLLYFLTYLSTLRTKVRRFSYTLSLASLAIQLATFACRSPTAIASLLLAGAIPPFLELRARGATTRVFLAHMTVLAVSLLTVIAVWTRMGPSEALPAWAMVPLAVAILIRCGIFPFHCWIPDLFDKATFGTALLHVAPLTGVYAAIRLVLPFASSTVLHGLGVISLFMVAYAAGMSLVQREARRFYCFLFLSHSALVLLGVQVVNPIGLTGALSLWLSVGLSLAGFGLTLRALESRFSRLSLVGFHGLYDHAPALAICFALTGLASVGFPGTLGFVGTEMLVDGAINTYPHVGIALVIAAAVNGIAVVRVYFRLFTGTRHVSRVSLSVCPRERIAVLTLAFLILGGGLYPQFHVASRYHAAELLLDQRQARDVDVSGIAVEVRGTLPVSH